MTDTFDEPDAQAAAEKGIALGISILAAAFLLVLGVVSIFQGISALRNDSLLVVADDAYVFALNLTTWGWIHLVIGILAVIVAGGLAAGTDWGRVTAIIVAMVSIITQFLWLPHYPAWAILIIVLDVIVIWAVATWSPTAV